jgi:ABC-type dipeptide/oligopeptide/nickel transport system ATPase subunit
VQAVFQDPWSSLNPRMKVGRTIAESLIVNDWGDQAKIDERVRELLLQVGCGPSRPSSTRTSSAAANASAWRWRGARLAAKLIVLDEPVSALDVSIRAQMMNLLKDIQAQDNVAYLLVAHDLATVRHMADHTVVMYLGKIVEKAPTDRCSPTCAIPTPRRCSRPCWCAGRAAGGGDRAARRGAVALESAVRLPLSYALPYVMPRCSQQEPALREVSPGHAVACHLFDNA